MFPGSRVAALARLPKIVPNKIPGEFQWRIGRELTGYSCGGSRGVTPRSLDLATCPNQCAKAGRPSIVICACWQRYPLRRVWAKVRPRIYQELLMPLQIND